MRPIDADALKDEIRKYANEPSKIRDRRWDTRCTAIIADMNGLINKAPTIGGWISAEDRLPEEHKLVLATDETFYVHVNWIVESKWIRPFHNRITYWMTIPNLPKEVDDDDT